MKIEKLSNYIDNADKPYCLVLSSYDDLKRLHNQDYSDIIDFINAHKKTMNIWAYLPIVYEFVHNEEEARKLVKYCIEEGDEDYKSIEEYAQEDGYKDAYEVLSGQADGYARFEWSKQGYLIDMVEV